LLPVLCLFFLIISYCFVLKSDFFENFLDFFLFILFLIIINIFFFVFFIFILFAFVFLFFIFIVCNFYFIFLLFLFFLVWLVTWIWIIIVKWLKCVSIVFHRYGSFLLLLLFLFWKLSILLLKFFLLKQKFSFTVTHFNNERIIILVNLIIKSFCKSNPIIPYLFGNHTPRLIFMCTHPLMVLDIL